MAATTATAKFTVYLFDLAHKTPAPSGTDPRLKINATEYPLKRRYENIEVNFDATAATPLTPKQMLMQSLSKAGCKTYTYSTIVGANESNAKINKSNGTGLTNPIADGDIYVVIASNDLTGNPLPSSADTITFNDGTGTVDISIATNLAGGGKKRKSKKSSKKASKKSSKKGSKKMTGGAKKKSKKASKKSSKKGSKKMTGGAKKKSKKTSKKSSKKGSKKMTGGAKKKSKKASKKSSKKGSKKMTGGAKKKSKKASKKSSKKGSKKMTGGAKKKSKKASKKSSKKGKKGGK
jgi:hypothetical protein